FKRLSYTGRTLISQHSSTTPAFISQHYQLCSTATALNSQRSSTKPTFCQHPATTL
ncbi:hypothetical protein TVAG_391970, partial [Trichomonas vaginalis G3]